MLPVSDISSCFRFSFVQFWHHGTNCDTHNIYIYMYFLFFFFLPSLTHYRRRCQDVSPATPLKCYLVLDSNTRLDGFVRTPMPACAKCHQRLPPPDSQSGRLMPVWSGPNKALLAFKRCPRHGCAAWLTHCFSLCEFWVMSWSTFGHSMKVKLRQGGRRVKGEPVLSVTEKTASIRPDRFKWCSQQKQKPFFFFVF